MSPQLQPWAYSMAWEASTVGRISVLIIFTMQHNHRELRPQSSLLLLNPGNMLGDGRMFEQCHSRGEMLGQLLLRNQIVDSRVAQPTDVDATRPQLLLRVPLLESLSPMNGLGNQVVEG